MPVPPILPLDKLVPRPGSSMIDPDFIGYTARSWTNLVATSGPVYLTEMKGADTYVICGHEADLAVWKTPDNWIYGPPSNGGEFFLEQMGESHVTQLDGDPHRRVRKLLLPAFGVAAVTRNLDEISEVVAATLADWRGQKVDLHPALSRMLTQCLSRHQVRVDLSDTEVDQLVTFEEGFIPAVSLSSDDRARWYGRPEYQQARQVAFDLFRRIAADRAGGQRFDDSLDLIVNKPPPDGMPALAEEELISAVYLLLVAGVGNIANVLCAALWALQTFGSWQDRLRDEVDGFDVMQLKQGMASLPLMKAFISEVERCHLPAPVIPKMSAETFDFMGYTIPAGVNVLQMHGLAHFDEQRYPDPFEFRPERWLESKVDRANAFGGGKHLCLGMGVTRLYVPLVLAMMLKSSRWSALEEPHLVPQQPDVPYSPTTTEFLADLS